MRNIKIDTKGNLLTITIDLSQKGLISKSGKSLVIASTEGNQAVGTEKGQFFLGVNCYKKAD